MFRLTREIRFPIHALPGNYTGHNGHGGVPAIEGLAFYFILRITLSGPVDRKSSYLRNIKEIDQQVRELGIPVIESLIRKQQFSHAAVLKGLHESLHTAWPGATLECIELCTSPYQSITLHASESTMIRLSQKFEFSAAHRLHNPAMDDSANRDTFGKCNNPHGHGHNYEVQVTLSGTPDNTGTLIQTHEFERIVNEHAIDPLDHKHLNVEVPEFKELNPSVENIAMVIHKRLKQPLHRTNVQLASVTVWETPKTWCEYSE